MALTIGITGANGYVGGRIAARLRAAGHRCIELLRAPPPGADARRFVLGAPVEPELCADMDVLIHCAWDMRASRAEQVRRINIDGSRALLAAAQSAGVARLLFISSMSAFADCRSLYGKAKLEVEHAVGTLGGTSIRPGLIYGPEPGGIVGAVLNLARRTPCLPMVGSGQFELYPCHEDDLVDLLAACCSEPADKLPPVLLGAQTTPRSFRDIVATLARRRLYFLPIPWRLIWAGLKVTESLGLRLRLKSDGLLGLVFSDPAPDFSAPLPDGVRFRTLNSDPLN